MQNAQNVLSITRGTAGGVVKTEIDETEITIIRRY